MQADGEMTRCKSVCNETRKWVSFRERNRLIDRFRAGVATIIRQRALIMYP